MTGIKLKFYFTSVVQLPVFKAVLLNLTRTNLSAWLLCPDASLPSSHSMIYFRGDLIPYFLPLMKKKQSYFPS